MQVSEYLNLKPIRLDIYLGTLFPELTRSTAKRIVIRGLAGIQDRRSNPSTLLKQGEKVFVDIDAVRQFIIANKLSAITPQQMQLDIIYEDANTLVVNKPTEIVVHPVYQYPQGTLLNGVTHYIIHESADPFVRAQPVHRLDRGTSGIILFSKNIEAHAYYARLFKRRELTKTYIALVSGDFRSALGAQDKLTVKNHITKNPLNRKYMGGSEGESAETDIYFEDYQNGVSKLKIIPHTGRTHQIRVHLSELGFPIIGDKIYGGADAARLLLHAWQLELNLFAGEHKVLSAPPPAEFTINAS